MTIRASICLAAITGTLGLFSIGSAHADSRLGAGLKALAPIKNIVTTVGHYDRRRHECCDYRERDEVRYREREHDRYRERDDDYGHSWVRRWRHRHVHDGGHRRGCCGYHRKRRYTRRHYPRFPRPVVGRNYEIYTYRRPRSIGPRTDVQWIYGRYPGYYYPYPNYPGVGY
jgi:hypothetical protein